MRLHIYRRTDKHRQTDRQAGRQAGGQAGRQASRQSTNHLHDWLAGALRESRKRREFKTTDVRITLGSNYRSNPAQ